MYTVGITQYEAVRFVCSHMPLANCRLLGANFLLVDFILLPLFPSSYLIVVHVLLEDHQT